MTTTARIDNDIKSLRRYFEKLFVLLQESIEESKNSPVELVDVESVESQKTFFHIDHFIKPDMVINIYSLVDYWLKEICLLQQKRNSLNLGYKDIKGNNDLHVFQKYLTKVVGLDLTSVSDSYNHLDNLRIVRNKLIHSGGHVLDENEQKKIANIDGIGLGGTLLFIDDSFIWRLLDHAKIYLFEAANF
jgi:hypothetical protein